MDALLEALLEALFEGLAQLIMELLFRSVAEPLVAESSRSKLLAAVGYFIYGAVAGEMTLLILPQHMIKSPELRVVGLFLSPLFAASIMSGLAHVRRQKDLSILRIDYFSFAYLFAFAAGLVRFYFAR